MLMDIFSSLDAGTYSNFSVSGLVWLSGFMGLFIVFTGVWVSVSSINVMFFTLANVVLALVKSCSGSFFGGFALGQVSLFGLVFIVNISGMVPNLFSPTSHLSLTLVLASMIWFCLVLSGWVYSWKKSASHLVPVGSPIFLIPLLVVIESVSILIRPVTLGVRLAANITMGHLMLHVIGEYVVGFFYEISFVGSFLGALVIFGYVLFEFAVSFLQAYVFVLLIGLYSSDHPMKG
uniref:ATP synthase F0 subunit 6 n=1 Tax=Lasmigona complanata TaxID=85050 RepID=UPI00226D2F18|nr:ATP synthase F0 subunit 6 [Lasmigona complanata]UZC55591.1 ATP synthase subunit 6 [Lasmigona complanata]